VRILPVVGFLFLCAFGNAEQFLSIPTAAKVPFKDVVLDVASGTSSGIGQAYADIGIGVSFETTLRFERPLDYATVGTFDFAYNYVSPISGLVPGIAFGVQDGLGRTPEGRRYYAAVTSRQSYTTESGDADGDVTLGIFVGQHAGGFVGINLPLSPYIHLVASHDGYVITAGIELRKDRNLGLRFVTVDGRPEIGLQTMLRF
jgi:hypothetical protein